MTDTTPSATTPGPDHLAAATPNRWIPTPAVRKAIYGAAVAVGALLVALGVVTQDQVTTWLAVIGNVFGALVALLALVNTPKAGS